MTVKTFDYVLGGLTLRAVVDETGKVEITCSEGHADLNALYWGNGDADNEGGADLFALSKATNALNMNGSGEVFDGSEFLSNAGLGTAGETKSTYITNGETLCFQLGDAEHPFDAADFAALTNLGIRATSTSTDGGSIKAVAEETPPHLSEEKLVHWNFEQPEIADKFSQITLIPDGWANLGGSLEIAEAPYGNIGTIDGNPLAGFAPGENQWLDTAASPGNVHIQATTDLGEGNEAQLTVSVAAQDLIYNGNPYITPAGAEVQFEFNGVEVLSLTLDDFKDENGVVQYNLFKTFTVDVEGQDGPDTLDVIGDNPANTFTGFSVDHITLQEWIV